MKPTASPTAVPPTAETASSTPASPIEKVPDTAAATATRYSTRAVASLSSPSPSRMETIRRGSPRRPATAVAATGSGGDTIAPSTTATAHGIPSTEWASSATAAVVTSTSPTASRPIGRRLARSCRRSMCSAAQYSSGGRNRARVSSGSSSTSGSPGIRATASPASSSSTGSGMAVRPASLTTTATAASRPISSSRVSI